MVSSCVFCSSLFAAALSIRNFSSASEIRLAFKSLSSASRFLSSFCLSTAVRGCFGGLSNDRETFSGGSLPSTGGENKGLFSARLSRGTERKNETSRPGFAISFNSVAFARRFSRGWREKRGRLTTPLSNVGGRKWEDNVLRCGRGIRNGLNARRLINP